MRPFSSPPGEPYTNGWPVPQQPAHRRPGYHKHVLLFLMTVVTTMIAGMLWQNLHPIDDIREFYRGFPYAGTLLAILFLHEMGHYVTARYYGIDVTLPYFIPMPPPIFPLGTLGAFIRMKSPATHRRALLYVGAAGPIAGFCVALPAMIYAYATATIAPIPQASSGMYLEFAEPLLLKILGYIILGPIPDGFAMQLNSVGIAAWFGLLVTMLNLLPVGQLDGGHIVYALFGKRARYISWGVIGILLAMGTTLISTGASFGSAWFLWAILGWVTSLRHPVVLDQHEPLNRRSRTIACIALVIFILCFMPEPISIRF
jgi:membrane-associated protease RseP (regulator of RpoE activity)